MSQFYTIHNALKEVLFFELVRIVVREGAVVVIRVDGKELAHFVFASIHCLSKLAPQFVIRRFFPMNAERLPSLAHRLSEFDSVRDILRVQGDCEPL